MSLLVASLILLAVLLGSLGPFQPGINATLAGYHGHPLLAALTNTVVASLVLAVLVVALRVPMPSLKVVATAPWWGWLGGVIGATLVFSSIVLAPKLGSATYVAASIVGTVVASMLIDHFGLVGFNEHPINGWRVIGGLLLIGGMLLVSTH